MTSLMREKYCDHGTLEILFVLSEGEGRGAGDRWRGAGCIGIKLWSLGIHSLRRRSRKEWCAIENVERSLSED